MALSHQSTWFVFKTLCAALNLLGLDRAMSSMLKFSVECSETKPGQAVFLVGSAPELGHWQIGEGTWVSGFAFLYEQIISDHNIIHFIIEWRARNLDVFFR